MTSRRTFIFAGGGTGGHLFPALAVAAALRDRLGEANLHTLFICSDRPLDAQILESEGVEHVPLRAGPFSVRPRRFVRFARSWGRCVRESRLIIRRLRAETPGTEVHLVAMGGFVAPPVVQAARVERVPITLINLDVVPGKANRWVARHADRVLTAAAVAGLPGGTPVPLARVADWTQVGPIVRPAARASGTREECRTRLGLDPARFTLLVCGGSQGARTINSFLLAFARAHPDALAGWQVLHQTGGDAADAEAVAHGYAEVGIPTDVEPFVSEMGNWWGAADLAVARSGAGTVAEAWANRVPCLFLPYPFRKDEHQRHNAAALAEAGGAIIETDRIEPAANLEGAGKRLATVLADAGRRQAMHLALASLGDADGAARAADLLLTTP